MDVGAGNTVVRTRVAALAAVTVAVLVVRPPLGFVAGLSALAMGIGVIEVASIRARRSARAGMSTSSMAV